MKSTKFCFFLMMYALFCTALSAQRSNAGADGDDLRVSRRLQPLWEMAIAPSRDSKEVILKSFESGDFNLNEPGVLLLARLAGAGTYYIDPTPGGLTDIRIRALSVLGSGGAEGAKAIEKVLSAETDPNAMAVAFYYLGEAGDTSDHRLIVMSRAMRRDCIGMRSVTAAESFLDAINKLSPTHTEENQSTYEILDALSMIIDSGYPEPIRMRAVKTLSVVSGTP